MALFSGCFEFGTDLSPVVSVCRVVKCCSLSGSESEKGPVVLFQDFEVPFSFLSFNLDGDKPHSSPLSLHRNINLNTLMNIISFFGRESITDE